MKRFSRPYRLPWLIAALAALATASAIHGPAWLHYATKPAATLACIAYAWAGGTAVSARYRLLIVVGMTFGLAGDVFLMLPTDAFIAGLASFLLGHLCYIAAFTGEGGWRWRWQAAVVPALLAAALFTDGGAKFGGLKILVGLYAATIAVMAWQAGARIERPGMRFAAIGGVAFVASDFLLALGKFGEAPVGWAWMRLGVLATYWLAQGFIARSVAGTGTDD